MKKRRRKRQERRRKGKARKEKTSCERKKIETRRVRQGGKPQEMVALVKNNKHGCKEEEKMNMVKAKTS